jgi:hypothetical protein
MKNKCEAVLWHGGGHQSKTYCSLSVKHITHATRYGNDDQFATWQGKEAFTGYFDEPPQDKSTEKNKENLT